MTIYRSRISTLFYIPLAVIFGVVIFLMVREKIWFMVSLFILLATYILHMTLTTYYQIEGNTLTIRSGFLFNKTVSIDTVRSIKEIRSPLSAPATSINRLEIVYNRFESVMISPKDKEGFISELTSLNANIEVKYRK